MPKPGGLQVAFRKPAAWDTVSPDARRGSNHPEHRIEKSDLMTGYLIRRTGQMVLTLFLIITFTFFLVQAQPGDYASFYVLNPDLPPEVKDQIRAAFGLDKPAWEQYLIHLKNTFTGNLGVSFGNFPRPVLDVLAGASASDAGVVPHRHRRVLLHRVLPGQSHRLAPGWLVRVRRHHLRGDAVHRLHTGLRIDDDLGVRLQAGLVSSGQVPGPPGMAGRRRQRQLCLRQYASQRGRLHHLRAAGHAAPQEVRKKSAVGGGPSDTPRRRDGHHWWPGPFQASAGWRWTSRNTWCCPSLPSRSYPSPEPCC